MNLKPEQLATELAKKLAGIYLISGDEPLLSIEAADQIRAKAREEGFTEREIFDGPQLDWQQVLQESRAMSLFSQRRILEIRLGSGPGVEGAAAIGELCKQLSDDILILILCAKLDKAQRQAKWVKTIEVEGHHLVIWPIKSSQLSGWLAQRLRQAGIEANPQAIEILAERVEGNLLAARQEIEKLQLILDSPVVDGPAMSAAVADSARYDLFAMVDQLLEGQVEEACRAMRGLRAEGDAPPAILWVLMRELRMLAQISEAVGAGQSFDTACQAARVWQNRQPLVRNALRRLKPGRLQLLLRQARLVDQISKGVRKGDAWLELENLALDFAGSGVRSIDTMRTAFQVAS